MAGTVKIDTTRLAKAKRLRAAKCARWRFPDRALHVVDIENLAGAAVPSLDLVSEVQVRYVARLCFGADDQVVMAASHRGLIDAACGWPHARYRVRSGKNGADLALIDVLEHENVAARFSHVVIGSGDGIFGQTALGLANRGVRITVVSRRGSLHHNLASIASDIIFLDAPLAAPLAAALSLAARFLSAEHRFGVRTKDGRGNWSAVDARLGQRAAGAQDGADAGLVNDTDQRVGQRRGVGGELGERPVPVP
jgi:hypothetical protein